jgi:hypothetical protein
MGVSPFGSRAGLSGSVISYDEHSAAESTARPESSQDFPSAAA